MHKFIKISLFSTILISPNIYAGQYNVIDAIKDVYGVIFKGDDFDFPNNWPKPGDYPAPGSYMDPYYKKDGPITMMGWYEEFSPSGMPIELGYNTFGEDFIASCGSSRVYQKMPIVNSVSEYKTLYDRYTDKDYTTKVITAYEGVPIRLSAHRHGGLNKELLKSYYYWEFGDGIRAFSDKSHDSDVEYTFFSLGSHLIKSFVLSTDYNIGIGYGGDTGSDLEVSGLKPTFEKGKKLHIEGCDFALVNVKQNHAPEASFSVYSIEPRIRETTFRLKANSTDIDGNKLSHKWLITGHGRHIEAEGDKIVIGLKNPDHGKLYFNVTVTSTDGAKSDSYTRTINTVHVRHNPGQEIP